MDRASSMYIPELCRLTDIFAVESHVAGTFSSFTDWKIFGEYKMNIKKVFSRRCFIWTLLIMLALMAVMDAGVWLGVKYLAAIIPLSVLNHAATGTPALSAGMEEIQPVAAIAKTYFIPVSAAIAVFFTLVLWLILRASFNRLMKISGVVFAMTKEKSDASKKATADGEDAAARKKALNEQHRRYYLNLLSVLQREGRLVDFFQEDLSLYSDERIGTAVRSIQENCRKSIQKALSLKSVIDKNEGESVTVMPDFDPGAIKLIGNVTGEPPFHGILRHKGWRASKIELPVLSAAQDAAIIAPAEVEIQ